MRDSAGFTPDFAGRAAVRVWGPGQPAKLPYWLITRLTRLTWSHAAGAISGWLAARHPPDICHAEVVAPGTAGSARRAPSSYQGPRQRCWDLLSSGDALARPLAGAAT